MLQNKLYLEYVGTIGVHQVIAVGFRELVGSPGAGLIILTLLRLSPSLGSKISRINTKYKVQSKPELNKFHSFKVLYSVLQFYKNK